MSLIGWQFWMVLVFTLLLWGSVAFLIWKTRGPRLTLSPERVHVLRNQPRSKLSGNRAEEPGTCASSPGAVVSSRKGPRDPVG
jgi:hypothetical protein